MSETDLVDSTSLNARAGLDACAHLGQLDEHDVAQGVLRVVGDADAHPAVLEPDPFVVRRVPQVVGDVHGADVTAIRTRRAVGRRRRLLRSAHDLADRGAAYSWARRAGLGVGVGPRPRRG